MVFSIEALVFDKWGSPCEEAVDLVVSCCHGSDRSSSSSR
jgi:hypothetical protein